MQILASARRYLTDRFQEMSRCFFNRAAHGPLMVLNSFERFLDQPPLSMIFGASVRWVREGTAFSTCLISCSKSSQLDDGFSLKLLLG